MTIRLRIDGKTTELDAPPEERLLDALRDRLGKTGVKEACGEGDCGACVVLVGFPGPRGCEHRAITSCLVPLHDVEDADVLTIHGLSPKADDPIRDALRTEHAVQCGFCTPGIVMALVGYAMRARAYDAAGAYASVAGQLCRCTGYASIRRACERVGETLGAQLPVPPPPGSFERIEALERLGWLPASTLAHGPGKVESPRLPAPGEARHAGGTDTFVPGAAHASRGPSLSLARHPRLRSIVVHGDRVDLGASTTFAEFVDDDTLRSRLPVLARWATLVASPPIRERATLGGNLVHASPVGDASVLLLALDAELELLSTIDDTCRTLPLTSFFLGYRQVDLAPHELVTRIRFDLPDTSDHVGFEKVGKRAHLDIASVSFACHLRLVDGEVRHARFAAGGVAPTPTPLRSVEAALTGRRLDVAVAREAMRAAESEATPIDDVRGSAVYKRRLLGRLLAAQLIEAQPSLGDSLEVSP